MSVTFRDDGKGKHQSWSAEVDIIGSTGEGSFSINLVAYGAFKEEARLSIDKLAQAAILKICDEISESHAEGLAVTNGARGTPGEGL